LQDRQSVERGDAPIIADVSVRPRVAGVARSGTAGCDLERDRGVCGGDLVVAARGRLSAAESMAARLRVGSG